MNRLLIVIVLVGLVLAGCAGQAAVSRPAAAVASTPIDQLPVNIALWQQGPTLPTAVPQAVIDAADAEYVLLSNVYERVAPSVVNIEVVLETPHAGINAPASGSGFIYDDQGHIITNAHVIQDATDISVTFHDDYVTTAEVVGVDSYSDLAVLRVTTDASRLIPVTIGDSNEVRVGQRAIAIGNPFGLATSMTVGIVSGLGRQLPSAELIDVNAPSGFQNPSIIQVDTDINPGNSGGPLLNSRGEVIGVNTAISTDTGVFGGVGFAVPSRTLMRVVPELIGNGAVQYAWIGIESLPSDLGFGVASLAEPLDLPVSAGVLIDKVIPGSPADKAGLRGGSRLVVIRGTDVCAGGDIIVAVNGEYVDNMDELVSYLVSNGRPGDTLNLLVVRNGETFEIPLELEGRPTSQPQSTCGSTS